jgi:penicillin-binding protein 1A
VTSTPRWRRWIRRSGIIALFAGAAMLGTAGGVLFAYSSDLPQITALDHYAPGTITRVLGRDGALVGEFATERREIVAYQDIPVVLRHAIMAAEDQHFMTHGGFHPVLMGWAAVNDVVRKGRTPGRSTITQQLARQLFPDTIGFERAWIRKMKEALVAVQIEKRYTKEEIFAMYCNKVAWGHGTYGVEAASRLYFGKLARELTLAEAATIAGMLPAPQRLNPYTSVQAATQRRDYTLGRMVEEGFISESEAAEARSEPVVPVGDPVRVRSSAPHFLEHVRGHLEERYGAAAIYEGGLTVRTGLDVPLQRSASRAMDAWLRDLDKRRGFRRPERNVKDEGRAIETYRHPRWTRDLVAGDIVPAVVTSIDNAIIHVRVNRQAGTIGRSRVLQRSQASRDSVRCR